MTHSLLGDWTQCSRFHAEQLGAAPPRLLVRTRSQGERAGPQRRQWAPARRALDDLLAARPNFTDSYLTGVPFQDRAQAEHFKQGLALAAGPEKPPK